MICGLCSFPNDKVGRCQSNPPGFLATFNRDADVFLSLFLQIETECPDYWSVQFVSDKGNVPDSSFDSVGELVHYAQNGVHFTLRVSTHLEFANTISFVVRYAAR